MTAQVDAKNCGEVDDEYCHAHSEYLRRAADISEKRARDRTFVREFVDFVRREDPSVLPAIQSILATGTPDDAAEFLGITDARLSRLRTHIRQLGKCFMTGDDHIPKQRRPYQKRAKRVATAGLVESHPQGSLLTKPVRVFISGGFRNRIECKQMQCLHGSIDHCGDAERPHRFAI